MNTYFSFKEEDKFYIEDINTVVKQINNLEIYIKYKLAQKPLTTFKVAPSLIKGTHGMYFCYTEYSLKYLN